MDSVSHHNIIPRCRGPLHLSRRNWTKEKVQIKTSKSKIEGLDFIQLATYLSLVNLEELRRFLATNRAPLKCSVWVSVLGVGLSSLSLLSLAASTSAQPKLDISTVYMTNSYEHTRTWLTEWKAHGRIKGRINAWRWRTTLKALHVLLTESKFY